MSIELPILIHSAIHQVSRPSVLLSHDSYNLALLANNLVGNFVWFVFMIQPLIVVVMVEEDEDLFLFVVKMIVQQFNCFSVTIALKFIQIVDNASTDLHRKKDRRLTSGEYWHRRSMIVTMPFWLSQLARILSSF